MIRKNPEKSSIRATAGDLSALLYGPPALPKPAGVAHDFPRYTEAYDVLLPIVLDMPAFMQDALADAVDFARRKREVSR